MARLTLKQIRSFFIIIAFGLITAGAGYWAGTNQVKLSFDKKTSNVQINRTIPQVHEDVSFDLFWEVWDRLSAGYFDRNALDSGKMVYGAIRGMVASLDDPYTVFLPPQDNKSAKEDLGGAFEGVGIQLGYKGKENFLAVVAPLSGMPAEKAGVKAGDLILKIDDKETGGLTLPDAVKLIRGPKGTSIKLTLLHDGETQPYDVTLTRETILVSSVEVEFIDDVAHLSLTRFGDRTNEEWEAAVLKILQHEPTPKGIVFDLRNNPGGYLTGSVFIASEFLQSGVVVQQESSDGTKEGYSVNRQGKLLINKLVVLVNQGSASASEIVAGALQDHKRAKIVGETTFGKGTIQEAQDLDNGSGLHVTTARWLLPSGRWINKIGVKPDVEVKDDPQTTEDEQLLKAIEVVKQ